MAPEILSSQRYTEKADVYSLGVVLWELLTRQCPYGEEIQAVQVAMAVLNEGRRPVIPSTGLAPPSYVSLFQWCWETIPENRPNVEQVLSALEAM